ncbi:MAG: HAMP domain-containing histidine kinase [Pseudomonadales bacterium]|nr:HAMP domain-containing histidine kinase [Pseudomonadales bacterium]
MTSNVDFSLLLASAVHDMKNSIGMLISTVEKLDQSDFSGDNNPKPQLALLHAEATRINSDLVNLLGVYRLDQDQLSLDYQECFVFDLLQDQLTDNKIIFDANNIDVTIECDDSISWVFDEQLISDVICNVLTNAAKYANKSILMRAEKIDGFLKVSVIDDGNGYPDKMLQDPDALKNGLNFSTGSTKLGLFFASRITAEHTNNNRRGYIQLENNESGGMFSLWLP